MFLQLSIRLHDNAMFFRYVTFFFNYLLDYAKMNRIYILFNQYQCWSFKKRLSTAIYWKTTSAHEWANTNNTKLNVYKKVLQEVCEKFDGAEEFIKDKIEEICSNGRGTLFVYERLRQLLVVFVKILQVSVWV